MLPTLTNTCFPDVKLLSPHVHEDARGHFLESWRASWGVMLPGFEGAFVQSNTTLSRRHVLRGLHYQRLTPQGKLLHVLRGEVYDVVVDVRCDSPGFGRWAGFVLSESQSSMLWVPPGYAHGFVVLSDEAWLHYQCTAYYAPDSEVCLRWDDPALAVDWPVREPLLSERDTQGRPLQALLEAGLCL